MMNDPSAPRPNRSHSSQALCLLAVFFYLASPAFAQGPPTIAAARLETPPAIDGEVLADPAWKEVVPGNGFRQTTPDEGHPATERTDIFVAYTEEALYFGVVCYDRNPEKIIVSDSRRDASLHNTDSIQIILDTFRDQRNGFVFGTNPAGIEYDGQVTNEGEGSLGFGDDEGFNLNWDGAWEVQAAISEIGWSAELAIPFRTLRFPKESRQSWGLNVQRNIRRRNETAFWAPLPRQHGLFRLSLAGSVTGIEVPSQRNLKIVPYVLAEGHERDGKSDGTGDAGIDLKYSITPSLTLDATYNTDFAQVEADELRINLDRFDLFFPEKRPFFLENAGLFAVGIPGELELYFSRRIGIGADGEAIPILGGVRLSGKAGRTSVGFLQMRSEAVEDTAPRNDFTVARMSRELPNRSSIGAIFVNRRGGGRFALDDDTNRTAGLDGRWVIGDTGLVEGFVATTDTPGLDGRDHAFRVHGQYENEAWLLSAAYTEVGEHFNPEVGFTFRDGYRRADFLIFHTRRPENLWGLHELRPHVSYRGFWNFAGFQETGFLHVDNHWEWKTGFEIHTGINFTREGVTEAFEIADGVIVPVGTYDHREADITVITNQGAPVSFEMEAAIGGFFGGDRVSLTPELVFRFSQTFNAELGWSYNDVDLPGGAFETHLGILRISYSFTPKLFVQGLFQYNDRADVWAANLRFGWLQAANTGLFLVYNESQELGTSALGVEERSVIVKYSRLIDLLK